MSQESRRSKTRPSGKWCRKILGKIQVAFRDNSMEYVYPELGFSFGDCTTIIKDERSEATYWTLLPYYRIQGSTIHIDKAIKSKVRLTIVGPIVDKYLVTASLTLKDRWILNKTEHN